jgi:hypothetical protein
MKYNRLLLLIVLAGCQPTYTSGKTECSDKKQCPSGFSCSDDGTNAVHYCIDNKNLPACASTNSTFYCSQSNTCWSQPGACSTVTYCGTAQNRDYVICATAGYVPNCNGTTCSPGTSVGTGGSGGSKDAGVGSGGTLGTGGNKDAGAGIGGALGTGGTGGIKTTLVGTGGSGGNKDAGGVDAIVLGGRVGTGGFILIGTGGSLTGGASGRGGASGLGGNTITASLCSGTQDACGDYHTSSAGCASEPGCVWDASSSLCTGTPSACSAYTSGTNCVYNGCTWAGTLICNATSNTSFCTSMSDGSTCDTCLMSSCCGQYTNCYNDTNCYNGIAGSLWDAYIACGMGCCKTACGY